MRLRKGLIALPGIVGVVAQNRDALVALVSLDPDEEAVPLRVVGGQMEYHVRVACSRPRSAFGISSGSP